MRFLLSAILMTLSLACIAESAEPVVLRTTVLPEDPWVGQQVLLRIDVLAEDGWAQAIKLGEVNVEGAYLMRLESQGTRLNMSIDGNSYSGQRYEFMLYPQRSGKLVVPSVQMDVDVTRWGASAGKTSQRVQSMPVQFLVKVPPGAESIVGLVSTSEFTATQKWSSGADDSMAGDALERVITLRAADLSGMAFAPVQYEEVEGLGIYPGEPTVDDSFSRGDLIGTRVETVSYFFEKPGDYEIPDFVLDWWDTSSEQLRQIVLPGRSLHVVANPAITTAVSTAEKQSGPRRVLWPVLAVLLISFLIARFAGRWSAWRQARMESENAYFQRIKRAARSGDQNAVLRTTMQWLDRTNTDKLPARLDRFFQVYGEEPKSNYAFVPNQVDTREFFRSLTQARSNWLKTRNSSAGQASLLPALNN